jgi:hypothetical protein
MMFGTCIVTRMVETPVQCWGQICPKIWAVVIVVVVARRGRGTFQYPLSLV